MQQTTDILNSFVNSWRSLALVLGMLFLFLTSGAWSELIRRLSVYIKRKDITVTTDTLEPQVGIDETEDYVKIQETLSDLNIHADKEFKDFLGSVKQHLLQRNLNRHEVRELIHSIFTIKEQYEFAYLNLYLVANAKHALRTLFDLGSVTKELLVSSISLPPDLAEQSQQKEVIFNALLSHHLIEIDEGLYQTSEKGKRFLEFVGLL